MQQENINYIELPVVGSTKITNLFVSDRTALLELTGTAGTITFRQSVQGNDYEQADAYVMSGTTLTLPLYNMTIGSLIEIETTGTITKAVIKWGA